MSTNTNNNSTLATTPEGTADPSAAKIWINPFPNEWYIKALSDRLFPPSDQTAPKTVVDWDSVAAQIEDNELPPEDDTVKDPCTLHYEKKNPKPSTIKRFQEPMSLIRSSVRHLIEEQNRQWLNQHVTTTSMPAEQTRIWEEAAEDNSVSSKGGTTEGSVKTPTADSKRPNKPDTKAPKFTELTVYERLLPTQQIVKTGYFKGLKFLNARAPHARDTLNLPYTPTNSSLGDYEVGHTTISISPTELYPTESLRADGKYHFDSRVHMPRPFLAATLRPTELIGYDYPHGSEQNLPLARVQHYRQGPLFKTNDTSFDIPNRADWTGKFRDETCITAFKQDLNLTVGYLSYYKGLSPSNRHALISKEIDEFCETYKSQMKSFNMNTTNSPHVNKWDEDLKRELDTQHSAAAEKTILAEDRDRTVLFEGENADPSRN